MKKLSIVSVVVLPLVALACTGCWGWRKKETCCTTYQQAQPFYGKTIETRTDCPSAQCDGDGSVVSQNSYVDANTCSTCEQTPVSNVIDYQNQDEMNFESTDDFEETFNK